MCRHAGYAGPTIGVGRIMLDLPHSLHHQSYAPRELLSGSVCADGFGMAWYDPDTGVDAARYANPFPIWSDTNLETMGDMVRTRLFLGAVRNATVAGTTSQANCAPFAAGRHSWSLNGYLPDFEETWLEPLRNDWVDASRRLGVRGGTDGEWLFAAALSRLDEDPEGGFALAIQGLLRDVLHRARESGVDVQLNVLASDGERVIGTRAGTGPSNSLYHLHDGHEFPDAHVIASEPLDDDAAWRPVEEQTVLVVQRDAPPVRLPV